MGDHQPNNKTQQMLGELIRSNGDITGTAEKFGIKRKSVIQSTYQHKEHLQKIYEEEGLTPQYIVRSLNMVAQNSENDMARIKSLELIGKHIGMWKERAARDDHDERSDEELLAEIQSLRDAVIEHRRKGAIEAEVVEVTGGESGAAGTAGSGTAPAAG